MVKKLVFEWWIYNYQKIIVNIWKYGEYFVPSDRLPFPPQTLLKYSNDSFNFKNWTNSDLWLMVVPPPLLTKIVPPLQKILPPLFTAPLKKYCLSCQKMLPRGSKNLKTLYQAQFANCALKSMSKKRGGSKKKTYEGGSIFQKKSF